MAVCAWCCSICCLWLLQMHGMTAEQFLWAVIKSELLYPKKLVFQSEDISPHPGDHLAGRKSKRMDKMVKKRSKKQKQNKETQGKE